eukprot:168213_1
MEYKYKSTAGKFGAYLILGAGNKRHTKKYNIYEFYCKREECGYFDDNGTYQFRCINPKTGKKDNKPACVICKIKKKDINKARNAGFDVETVPCHVSIRHECIHYGYIERDDNDDVSIKSVGVYHHARKDQQPWDFSIRRHELMLKLYDDLSNDMKLCGNYYRVPTFHQYNHAKGEYKNKKKTKFATRDN